MKIKEFKIEYLWAFVVLGMCFAYVSSMPVDQYDFWHYIKTGNITWHTHKIIDKEIFTFTAFNKSYINLHWASQLYYYFFYSVGGIPLLAFMHALIITGSFLLVFKLCLDYSKNMRIAAIATFISIVLSVTNFALRPQEFSILFFALTLFLLKKEKYYFIPLLFLLWVNIHGAFVTGLILVTVEVVGSIKFAKKFEISTRLLTLLILCFITTLFTPWGLKLYPAIFNIESQNLSNLVTEWFSPSLHTWAGLIFFINFLSFFILKNFSTKNWNRTDILTFIVFAVLALRSQRAIIWWAIATAPILALHLNSVILNLKIKNNSSEENLLLNYIFALILALYIVFCLPWLKPYNIFLPKSKHLLIALDTPCKLADKLNTISSAHHIFNNFSWGSYFMWSLKDNQKIFISPWLSVFPKKTIHDYLLISNGNAFWEKVLRDYDIDTLALGKEEQGRLLTLVNNSPNWVKIYEDEIGVIFKKTEL